MSNMIVNDILRLRWRIAKIILRPFNHRQETLNESTLKLYSCFCVLCA